MSRPDEGLIHQWLDGECTPEESARLEHLVATDPEWAAAVAEARGLIAASSRIVQSLDAVPRAMPQGSTAAPRAVEPAGNRFTVRPWMRAAAVLVVVAGSAYVLSERQPTSDLPAVTVDVPSPPPAAPQAGSIPTTDRIAAEPVRSAGEGAPTPVVQPPPAPSPMSPPAVAATPERTADTPNSVASVESDRATQESEMRTRGTLDATRARRAALSAAPPPAMPEPHLAGCWRVSAPPALAGVLIDPPLRRQAGDTLVLITALGDLTSIREDDVLRGAVMATRETCPESP